MSSDTAIKVESLSKCYQIYDNPRDRLMQMLRRGKKTYYKEFWALKDISFEIKRGETTGIIGRNGSGKSTLLQIICGTLNPTAGTVAASGRIAALLELGSGFNPEFTGSENIYMNGAVLGLAKEEIDAKFEDIVAFADIGQFINQPVKTYSSGMMVRLAFAVQSQIDPDILIIDEALAVGDAKFQAKCFERLKQLKNEGTSILLVTHSSEQIVTHCSNAILLDAGIQVETGAPRQVVNHYLDLLFGKERIVNKKTKGAGQGPIPNQETQTHHSTNLSSSEDRFSIRAGYNPHEYRWGDGSATILDFELTANGKLYPSTVATGDTIELVVAIKFERPLVRPVLGITIKTKEGVTVYGANSETLPTSQLLEFGADGSVIHVQISFQCNLAAGDYFISLGLATKQDESITPHDRRYDSIHLQVQPDNRFFGLVNLDAQLKAYNVGV